MRQHNRFSVFAVVVSIMAGGIVSEANAYPGRGGGSTGRLLKGLNLTNRQKQETQGLLEAYRREIIGRKVALLQARRNLLTIISDDRLDEKVIHTAFSTLAVAEQDLTFLQAKMFNELMPLLNPDQQTTIKNKVARMSLRAQRSLTKLQSKLSAPLPGDQEEEPGITV